MDVTIIDDEPPAIDLLSAYIQRTKSLVLRSAFTDPMDALDYFSRETPPQLTFLDIDMPGISGLDLARIISPKTSIVLTTSFRDYGPEAFTLSVSDYLLKPFSFERFLEAVGKTPQHPGNQPVPGFFFVRTETRGRYLRVTVQDIISAESKDNQTCITLSSGTVAAMHTLSDIQAWLPATQFSRVHHSYLVNLAEIHMVDHGKVYLKTGAVIPIGRRYRDAFMESLDRMLVTSRP